MILLGEDSRAYRIFVFPIRWPAPPGAPCGEDPTLVAVGGEERQPVSNPLESVQRTARAVLRTPDTR